MTEYLTMIPELLLSLLHLLIIRKYMKVFWGPENRNLKGYIEWGIYYVFLIINNVGSVFPPQLLLFGNVLLIFMISSATRKRSVMQRCIFSILICTVWMLVEVIVLMILMSIGFDPRTLQDAGSFISKMCMLLLSVIISHCIKDNHYSEIPLLYFLSILLIPVSSIYMMHHIFLIAAVHNEYMIFSATASFLLLVVNYVIFEVYDWISRNAELREQNRLYAQQLDLCSQQAEERESLYLEIRRIRHDLRNHLSGLLGMVQAGQTNEAERYIMQMLDVATGERPEEVSRSGNIVVDSLINNAYAAAQKDNIQFNVNVLVPASLPFESGHLAIVLGNLLENALEACRDIPGEKGFICLDISYAKDIFQLCIKNNYQEKRKKDNIGHYLTTKADNIYHGLGLSSINHAVVNYHGQMDITDNDNIFQVIVIMYGSYSENAG
ncbi:MAG: GHKL domain-containing protein [Lachnospiraceae bacterium]|nr:GHKL domain-containing protein [Lachnospiraceae bacterium]